MTGDLPRYVVGNLPRYVTVAGEPHEVRTDYRDILNIISAINDPELEDYEKAYALLVIFYPDLPDIPEEDLEAAYKAAVEFIEYGADHTSDKRPSKKLVDWEQDERIMIPAINKVAGMEIRTAEYLHWWTFLGYYMEITEGVYSQVLALRSKKARNKKLEKWEREFWANNRDICAIKPRLSQEEMEARDRLNAMLG